MTHSEEHVRKTYRYLRVSIVALALLLFVSIAIELAGGVGRLDSISAYYYTPVRSVFVGTLVAVGVSLVAIRGHLDSEDVLLNLAGMLLPVVAFVPTPLLVDGERYVPDEHQPAIENNVTALLVVGGLAVAFAAWTASTGRGGSSRASRFGVAAGIALWGGLGGWFLLHRESFFAAAHYVAAVLFFGCVIAVTWISRRYRWIGGLMLACLAVAGVLFVLRSTGAEPSFDWVFHVEAALLVLFTVYWVAQTAEHWHEPTTGRLSSDMQRPG